MKISIFSFAVNDKFPIDIMHRQFLKYIKEDFDFILFNDATDDQMKDNINTIASYNKINCVRVPQSIHKAQNPSEGYANALNWSIQEYAVQNNCEVVVLVHADILPIHEIHILDILGENIVASTMELKIVGGKEINYFYPALTIINMKALKNVKDLDFGLEVGLDTGGKTNEFVKNNSTSIKRLINHPACNFHNISTNDSLVEYFQEDLNICGKYGCNAGWVADGFYHYTAGSQWNANINSDIVEGHENRLKLFLKHFY